MLNRGLGKSRVCARPELVVFVGYDDEGNLLSRNALAVDDGLLRILLCLV